MSIAAVQSISLKIANQDSCKCILIHEPDTFAIMVADGIGSFPGSEKASSFVCVKASDLIAGIVDGNLTWRQLFLKIQNDLNKQYEKELPEAKPAILEKKLEESNETTAKHTVSTEISKIGTTFIAAFETEDTFKIAYAGNGAVFHLRANFNQFPPEVIHIPWSSMNYLNPHSNFVDGSEVLYKFIATDSNPADCVPTELIISKDNEFYGDILMICTDGIASNDQAIYATSNDPSGIAYWVKKEKTMDIFYKYLQEFITSKEVNAETLEKVLKNLLCEYQLQNLLEDDSTIGLIITDKALKYYHLDSHGN
jgi:PPM family protein phosphatase